MNEEFTKETEREVQLTYIYNQLTPLMEQEFMRHKLTEGEALNFFTESIMSHLEKYLKLPCCPVGSVPTLLKKLAIIFNSLLDEGGAKREKNKIKSARID